MEKDNGVLVTRAIPILEDDDHMVVSLASGRNAVVIEVTSRSGERRTFEAGLKDGKAAA
jgi:uncharacterized phosphosugar-binding protein